METEDGEPGPRLPPGMWITQDALALMVAEGRAKSRKNAVYDRALTVVRREVGGTGQNGQYSGQTVTIAGVTGLGIGVLGTVMFVVLTPPEK